MHRTRSWYKMVRIQSSWFSCHFVSNDCWGTAVARLGLPAQALVYSYRVSFWKLYKILTDLGFWNFFQKIRKFSKFCSKAFRPTYYFIRGKPLSCIERREKRKAILTFFRIWNKTESYGRLSIAASSSRDTHQRPKDNDPWGLPISNRAFPMTEERSGSIVGDRRHALSTIAHSTNIPETSPVTLFEF